MRLMVTRAEARKRKMQREIVLIVEVDAIVQTAWLVVWVALGREDECELR